MLHIRLRLWLDHLCYGSEQGCSQGGGFGRTPLFASDHDVWRCHNVLNCPLALIIITTWTCWQASKRRRIPGGYRSITELFSTGSSSSCLPRAGVSSPNAADAVVDDDETSRQCSDWLPETETSGSCLGSSGDDQLEDDEMALNDNGSVQKFKQSGR